MQKELQTKLMHPIRFRERERLSDEPCESLPQRVNPPLDMRRLARRFADRRVLRRREHQLVRFPEVAKTMQHAISCRDARPQLPARRLGAVADHVSDDLARGATQRQPNPAFVRSFQHK